MKAKSIVFVVLFGMLIVNLYSCKKKDEAPVPTKSEIISREVWNWDKLEQYSNDILFGTVYYNGFTMEFKKNHQYYAKSGDGSIIYEGEWDVNEDGNILYLNMDGEFKPMDIVKLDEHQFVFSYTISSANKPNKINGTDKKVYYLSR